MQERPINSKNVSTLLLIAVMTLGFTCLYLHFSLTIKDEPAVETVEFKYSKKGLYLYPRFEVFVSNSERPSKVSKEQFESIQAGDKISGYMKNADTFVTEKDIRFEKTLAIPIFLFLYLSTFSVGLILLNSTKFIKNNQLYQKIVQRLYKISIYTMLTLYLLIGTTFVALTATNIFHKLNTWNQTEVTATILGGDFNEVRTQKGASYTTYELFLRYQDKQGEDYITRKAVTGTTYSKYKIEEPIPLIYRNNNVYDTFVLTESAKEIWPAFINLYTIFIGIYIFSLFAMIRSWRKKKRKQNEIDSLDE
ncbi:hypothetical protein [Oceanobacillus sojae]|uniref:hypothetical protein n=1 Tax=Oceanobacillus sojae TaxID=582851 RepID=UPI0009887E02|nr:hypothetical protein [Oceanobacillus sojae]MCT1902707.1 hypothetical protein [Oceanobacillus sojae]